MHFRHRLHHELGHKLGHRSHRANVLIAAPHFVSRNFGMRDAALVESLWLLFCPDMIWTLHGYLQSSCEISMIVEMPLNIRCHFVHMK